MPAARMLFRSQSLRGFTLIEALLVIAVIGLLVTLATPLIYASRESGRRTRAMADLRGHAAVFSLYMSDNRDLFPYVTDPRGDFSVVRCRSAGLAFETPYFWACYVWNIALADDYYESSIYSPSFRSPWESRPNWILASSYWYPCVFIADPSFWKQETRQDNRSQLVATRGAQVLFPSHKVILFVGGQISSLEERMPTLLVPTSFVDGSASLVRGNELTPQYNPWPDGRDLRLTIHAISDEPFLHTIDGVRGRDVTRR